MKRSHTMPFGARLLDAGGVEFRLWAPAASRVELVLVDTPPQPMRSTSGGWFSIEAPQAVAGARYAFRIDGGLTVPDPASRFNPDDVHAPSEVIDPQAYPWRDDHWRGRAWHEAVIYELHVGTFTRAGTFAAAIERLDDLVHLGATVLELMPVADFRGRRNWGYDGVLPFAPDASYGRPDDLKRLVDEAHRRGLMMLLDVVYNHFGPDGNYLHVYAPQFFNSRHPTPWGAAINFDGDECRTVREFFINNALYWLEEFHFDGLRLDAVHAMVDSSRPHIVEELARAVEEGPGRHRRVHLILENDRNEARFLAADDQGRARLATAQWNDDVHHAAHVLATGEADGYYADYAEQPLQLFARALAEGFGFQGQPSAYRGGAARGEACTHLPPQAFVDFLQTHDQVGNRALGERIGVLSAPDRLRALAACVWLAPAVPLLFMGEEFAASTPFLFFCDFEGTLALAVTRGRREEFSRFGRFADATARERIPDPNAEESFVRSKLDWSERARPRHRDWLEFTRGLLARRQAQLAALLPRARSGRFEVDLPGRIAVHWPLLPDGHLHLLANLADTTTTSAGLPPGAVIYASHAEAATLPPWSVRWSLEAPHG